MASAALTRGTWVHVTVPLVAVVVLALTWGRDLSLGVLVVPAILLTLAVLSAVHHAEVVALRVGEPFGSLVLAVAVTVVEVALIVTLMLSGGPASSGLARDTVFAAIMITVNGIVGLSILVSTLRGGSVRFHAAGAGSGLAAITVLATLTLVLPTFTRSSPGPTLTTFQLAFAALAALTIYLAFVFMQTVRHRDYFLPPERSDADHRDEHVASPGTRTALTSLVMLLLCLIAVVGLAKVTTPLIEAGVTGIGLPVSAVAVSIALLVLLPESFAAVRAARRGRFQTSINLAYGSAMASIGLTIPVIAVVSGIWGMDLMLGLSPTEILLFAVTVATGILTVTPGRATLLQGIIHLSLMAGFLVLVVSP